MSIGFKDPEAGSGGMLSTTAQGAAMGSSFGPWGSVIGAGIGAAASLFGGKKQNDANAAMARQQMEFQERMRATQYQTAVADLKAAGLNPMLAYSQGGAGTPVGATAQMGNPLGEAGNSAREAAMAVANFKQLQTQNELTQEQAKLTYEQAAKTEQDKKVGAAQVANIDADTTDKLNRNAAKGKFGNMQDTILRDIQNRAEQSVTQSAYQGAQTQYTKQLTRLAKKGYAPSPGRPIYKDIVGLSDDISSAYKAHPEGFHPFGIKP
jgi:hypothetical protein